MVNDERLTERVLGILGDEPSMVQKKMFGGVAFMLQGNLACGVVRNDLIVRVPRSEYEAALARPHVREMDFTARPCVAGWSSDSRARKTMFRCRIGWPPALHAR